LEKDFDISDAVSSTLAAHQSARDEPLQTLIRIGAKKAHTRDDQYPLGIPNRTSD
jgi:hypothetical protein